MMTEPSWSSSKDGLQGISAYLRSQCPFLSTLTADDSSPGVSRNSTSSKDAAQTPFVAPAPRRQNRRSHEVPAAVSQTSPKKKYSSSPRKQFVPASPNKEPSARHNRARKALTLAAFAPNNDSSKQNGHVETPPKFSVESSDDFPSLGAMMPPAKPPQVRRIRPTAVGPVVSDQQNGSLEEASTFSSTKPTTVSTPDTDASERAKLLIKRLDSVDPVVTPSKTNKQSRNVADENDCSEVPIEACPELVTRRNELNAVTQTFIQFLEFDCTSIFEELQFLVSLLCVRSSLEKENEASEPLLLATVHNCVYLASTVLQDLEWLIVGLDEHFIEELASNDRMSKFVPGFCSRLRNVPPRQKAPQDFSSLDCLTRPVNLKRDDFPDQTSFHAFKRQRDTYHEIKRDYEESACEKDVVYFECFGNRVRGLIKTGSHTVNYALLAQLFTSEIIKIDTNTDNSSFQTFPDADAERLNRLTKRLTTSDNDDPISVYDRKGKFVGRERFFRDFLLHSDSYLFTVSLRDQLWAKIQAICFQCFEQKCDITVLLKSACLLSKFLGYFTFQPYQQSLQFPESLIEKWTGPLDSITLQFTALLQHLQKEKNSVDIYIYGIVICHFLSVADAALLTRESHKDLVQHLLAAYRCAVQAQMSNCSTIYLCAIFHVDWLLSMPHMTIARDQTEKIFDHDKMCKKSVARSTPAISVHLNDMCPWLSSLHSSLLCNKQSSETPTQRKIRPVTLTAVVNDRNGNSPHARIMSEMERQFFAQLPAHVRKVVDTVTECFTHRTISSPDIDQAAIKDAVHSLLSNSCSDCVVDAAQKFCIRNINRIQSDRPPLNSSTDSTTTPQSDTLPSNMNTLNEPFQELGPLLQRMREVTIDCIERRACKEAVTGVVNDYRNMQEKHEQLRRPFVRTATAQLLSVLEKSLDE